jgi:aldehyde:ferredoxin oxidoreductase
LEVFKDLINARYGLEIDEDDLTEMGKETLRTELKFNEGSEFGKAHGLDPEFVRNEPLAPTGNVFDVEPSEIAGIWERLEST